MKIAEVMTRDVRLTSPEETIEAAARRMAQDDVGVLPVGEDNRVIGMLTDRDITVRAIAEGRDPKATRVREAMSGEVAYCYEDDDIERASAEMERLRVRRLPIVDRDKKLVGMLGLSNIAHGSGAAKAGETLKSVAKPH